MDNETAGYIVDHFSELLTNTEAMAIRHTISNFKMESMTPEMREKMEKIYLEKGWITKDQGILELIEHGVDHFNIRVATRILAEHGEKVILNCCPKCNRLARTPLAKQCRYCGFDWHYS